MLELLNHLSVSEHIAYGAYTAVRAGGLSAFQTEAEKEAWNATDDHEWLDQ